MKPTKTEPFFIFFFKNSFISFIVQVLWFILHRLEVVCFYTHSRCNSCSLCGDVHFWLIFRNALVPMKESRFRPAFCDNRLLAENSNQLLITQWKTENHDKSGMRPLKPTFSWQRRGFFLKLVGVLVNPVKINVCEDTKSKGLLITL